MIPQSTPTYANPSMPPPGFGSDQKLNTMEKNFNSYMQSTNQMLQSNQQAIQQLTLQMTKMSSQMCERERGTFPSQPEINPRDTRASSSIHAQINAIHTLRSGKEVDNQVVMPDQTNSPLPMANPSSSGADQSEDKETEQITEPPYDPPAPFPNRLKSKKHTAQMEKILEIFKQVKVNVPLLDAIEQVPSYAKFLKDLCTKKRAHQTPKKVFLAANISGIIQNSVPVKYKDPGCPTISCTIGTTVIDKALLDLGASVNLLPYSVYKQLGVGELKPTKVTLQLADRSVKVPLGEIADVLIKVGEFIFPVDFVVLETAPVENPRGQIPVILGRPFLATSNALINCRSGLMKLTFGNMTVDLNIFNLEGQKSEPSTEFFEVNMIQSRSNEFEDDHMDSDFGCTHQSFDELCEEEIRMFEEINQQVNHVSSLIQEMADDHIDNESINYGYKYCEQSFEKIFEDELLLLDELDGHTFPIGFFDKRFEEIFDDELKFLAIDQACSHESEDNKIGLGVNVAGVSLLSNLLKRRKRKRKRIKKKSVKIKFKGGCAEMIVFKFSSKVDEEDPL